MAQCEPRNNKKQPELSSVAAIVDAKGGIRVVITERWRMRYHVGPGERLFVVPGCKVQEPVPVGNIPGLVERAIQRVKARLE